jgi:outer membrane biogenesis lipoprotein LolB
MHFSLPQGTLAALLLLAGSNAASWPPSTTTTNQYKPSKEIEHVHARTKGGECGMCSPQVPETCMHAWGAQALWWGPQLRPQDAHGT